MRFQHRRCDFNIGDAISTLAMQFQHWQCDFNIGDAISTSAVRFQLKHNLLLSDFSVGDAIPSSTHNCNQYDFDLQRQRCKFLQRLG
jgi:hypothetical protein